MKKILFYISCLLNMISKRRVIRRINEGGHFTNDIPWIKRKHLFNWQTLDPNARIWSINLKNRTSKIQKVSLFSIISDPLLAKENNIIDISVPESSYESIRADLISSKYHVEFIRAVVNPPEKSKAQFETRIFLNYYTSTGVIEKRPYCFENYRQKNQYLPNIIDDPSFWTRIDKHTTWEITLLPETELSLILYFFAITNVDKTLINLKSIYQYPELYHRHYFPFWKGTKYIGY